ncbi:MAG TPA: pyrroloquinoline quinone-dependent dehydrogenase [Rhizomicrobium sp.]|nr:pyrroloquinoline quinone-dependent dehydrogenase [Rhizomicrobium sp.]
MKSRNIMFAALGFTAAAAAAFALLAAPGAIAQMAAATDNQVWDAFGGNQQAQKYSTGTQITPDNVKNLKRAWSMHTGDVNSGAHATTWGATPLFVNNTVYVGTPKYRVYAVEPDTGKVKWVYAASGNTEPENQGYKNRGVAYWQASMPVAGQPCQKIIYLGTMDGELDAMDADTGKSCPGFGKGGVVNVDDFDRTNHKWKIGLIQPPAVYKDTLILGWAGNDWVYKTDNPGTVYGIDARTGALKWTFNPIPKAMLNQTGTANVWAGISVDPETGLAFLPVSSPSPNYYGGDRLTEMPLVTATVAVKAETGEVVWSRQLVHHDIWDLDLNSAPTLLDIKKGGQTIPALIQATKMGFLFVLNRNTGEPVYPIEERKVPASDVPGEHAAPTQPYVAVPRPTIPDTTPPVSLLADIASFGECSRWKAQLRDEGRFTPPSLKGSIAWPATTGGVEWGGGALDPTTNTYVVNSNRVPQVYTLIPRAEADRKYGSALRGQNGYAAQAGSAYGFRLQNFLNIWGMPCWAPPYGTLLSYDMNSGKVNWEKPFGAVQKWGFYMPDSWGSVTIGAPVITKTGLVFIGASMDSRVRAVDLKTGKVLWKAIVDAPAVAQPAVYTYKGRQYVVFAAGGNGILTPRLSDQLVAFALPN